MKFLNYSWKEYLIVLAIILVVYYTYIILRYYRHDFINFLKGKSKAPEDYQEDQIIDPFKKKTAKGHDEPNPADAENYALAEELIGRIKDLVFDATDDQIDENEFLQQLRSLFAEYSGITDKTLRFGISEMVLADCNTYGRFSLDRRTVDDLWDEKSS